MRSLIQSVYVVFVGVVIAIGEPCLSAQAARDVVLTVQVTDISGAVAPGAQIALDRDGTTVAKLLKDTNEKGLAVLFIEPGIYRLSVALSGFIPAHQRIEVGDMASLKIGVKLRPGSLSRGPFVIVDPVWQRMNELMPMSSPLDSVWVDEP